MASTPKKKAPAAKPKAAAAKLPAAPAPRERRQRVQSAETGMAVLKGLARMGGNAGLSGLAAHVGESPAKVHRYLASLVQEGLVAQDVDSQRYRLGPEAINIGLAAMRQSDPVRAAEPALVRLREGLEVTCFVAVMGNKGPTVMRFEEPGLPVTVNVRAGSVMSMLWSATGRAFLGLLNERSVRELAEQELAAAPREMRAQLDAKQPIEALRDTYLRGISAVAAPVHDFTGRVCAVITALGASGGFDPSADGEIATAVLREAAATSEVLGYLVPKEC